MIRRFLSLVPGFGVCCFLPAAPRCRQDAERAEFRDPPSIERTLSKEAPKEKATSFNWPSDQWWHQFGSPDLDRVMEIALRDNPGLMKAYDRIKAADAVAQVEGARLLPWLDADAEVKQSRYAAHGVVFSYNPTLGGAEKTAAFINPLSFRYEFDFWGKNRAIFNAALGEAAAEEAQFAEARLVLTTAIARAYIRGVSLAQQLAVAQERVALRRELLQLAQTRFRTGLDTDDVVKQANIDLETANKREAGTRALLVLHQDLLAQLMGDGPDVTQNLFAGKEPRHSLEDIAAAPSSNRAARAPAGSRLGHAPGGGGFGANPCRQGEVSAVRRSGNRDGGPGSFRFHPTGGLCQAFCSGAAP